jgi:hypothetical protein
MKQIGRCKILSWCKKIAYTPFFPRETREDKKKKIDSRFSEAKGPETRPLKKFMEL